MHPAIRRVFELSPTYHRLRYARKIAAIHREAKIPRDTMDPAAERDAVRYWRRYGVRLNLAWHRAYSAICPAADAYRFVPEDIYYAYIEKTLNRYDLAEAYSDKNNYDRLFGEGTTLPVLLRLMNRRRYDTSYAPLSASAADALLRRTDGEYIVKPSIASGDGVNVRKVRVDGGTVWLDDEKIRLATLEAMYDGDFLIQPYFHQHPAIAEFHPTSVNTIRFYTYRLNDAIHIASAVLRLGNCGRHVDNRGIPCGVTRSGALNDQARTKYFQKFDTHPVTGKPFKGFVVPGWEAAREKVKRLHEQLPYFDAVSWDITIGPDRIARVVELNLCFQEINFLQVNNGPLYGDRTDELLTRVFGPPRATTAVRVSLAGSREPTIASGAS